MEEKKKMENQVETPKKLSKEILGLRVRFLIK